VAAIEFPEGVHDVDTPQDLAQIARLKRLGPGFPHR
jgi:hypothetical protein